MSIRPREQMTREELLEKNTQLRDAAELNRREVIRLNAELGVYLATQGQVIAELTISGDYEAEPVVTVGIAWIGLPAGTYPLAIAGPADSEAGRG